MRHANKTLYKAITFIMVAAVLVCAWWIMRNRLGLSDKHDFGAGAYYYADIPDFDKVIKDDAYHSNIPKWIYFVLFFAWEWLMWRLWCWIDGRKRKDKEQN